jgi:hypothetical protein
MADGSVRQSPRSGPIRSESFTARTTGHIDGLREKLKSNKRDCPVVWLTEKGKSAKGHIAEPGVKILTMHGSKGARFGEARGMLGISNRKDRNRTSHAPVMG